jgi:hypothetical protein
MAADERTARHLTCAAAHALTAMLTANSVVGPNPWPCKEELEAERQSDRATAAA